MDQAEARNWGIQSRSPLEVTRAYVLLLSRALASRKLESEEEPGLELGHSSAGVDTANSI